MNTMELINRLEKVKRIAENKWIACCPAHDDKTPSMRVTEVDDRVLIHCFAGCGATQILDAVGLDYSVLMPEKEHSPLIRTKQEKNEEDEFIIMIFQNAIKRGERPTEAERKMYRDAVHRKYKNIR